MEELPCAHLLINESDLRHVLASRKVYIGGSAISAISLLAGGLHELNDFRNSDSSWIAYILLGLGVLMMFVAIWEVYKAMKYNHEKLGKEIIDLDQTAHHHSIVAIRDKFQKFPNRYLVYEDKAWQCRFFLNYPTQLTETENVDFLKRKISGALKIPVEVISLTKKGQALQQKYSERHHEMRVYDHVFYEGEISDFPEALQETSFILDGVTYYWMTLEEMKQDTDIQKKNLDVVKEVEKLI